MDSLTRVLYRVLQTFTEHLLGARHCARREECRDNSDSALASGISESGGGGRWTQSTAVMKARTRSSEIPRRAGHSEGLAEPGGWRWS